MLRERTLMWALPLLLIVAGVANPLAAQPAPPGTAKFAIYHPDEPGTPSVVQSGIPRTLRKAVTAASATGDQCTKFDFEGLGDSRFVPDFDDISLPGWISTIEDTQPGGHGNFSNEPSPVTTVFWSSLFGNPTSRDILFGNPVSSVSFSYASAFAVQLQAFDKDGNVLATANGPRNGPNNLNRYTNFSLLGVSATGDKIAKVTFHGYADYTGIDDLKVCRRPKINAVEVTQAIQEYQKIADLETSLAAGDPPVPIVAYKPGVLRVYFDEMQVSTRVFVNVQLPGAGAIKLHTIPPSCSPDKQRRRTTGCFSFDVSFTPPPGPWTATVTLEDSDANVLETHSLPFTSHGADFIHQRAVSVCDAKDAGGNWLCQDDSSLPGMLDLLRRMSPTASVTADVTSNVVRLDKTPYLGSNSDKELWWVKVAAKVNQVRGLFDTAAAQVGVRTHYVGIVNDGRAPGNVLGIANDIPARGAAVRSKSTDLGTDITLDTLAHETGHLLGRRHTNTNTPFAGNPSPPGCGYAGDPSTDWPFADNLVHGTQGQLEVGFDIAFNKPRDPAQTMDIMSYCVPVWISPFTYTHELSTGLNPGGFAKSLAQVQSGPFWTVSGVVVNGALQMNPVFVRNIDGSAAAGAGTHSIVVKNGGGSALFTRFFTPERPIVDNHDVPQQLLIDSFFELIPVQPGAARIVVLGPGNVEISSVTLGGAAPTVAFVTPAGGTIAQGQRDVRWTITDPDSAAFTSELEYSPDGGARWIALGDTTQSALRVDFDRLPGARGTALLRVYVSDGANTGTATSAPFAVPGHLPVVTIVDNGRSHFRQGDLVWLRADAIDRDDGVLDGNAVQWLSNRSGLLGTGASLPVYTLPAGVHTITVIATDADGNRASASEQITIAGMPPSVSLTSPNAPVGARSCAELTLDAAQGSPDVPLSAVRVSLDGGQTFLEVADLSLLPFTFVAPDPPPPPPGSPAPFGAYYHVLAHALDAAGQYDVKDLRLFVGGNCTASNLPPVANAGPDRTVFTPGGPASILLDGSKSSDPDSISGNDDIVAFDWFEDYGLVTQTSLGSGPQLQVPLAIGIHHISLRVTDNGNLKNVAQVTITVQAGLVSSTTALGASANPSVFGQSVTFTAAVAGSNPTGQVTFKDGAATLCNAVPLAGGQAQCATGALSVGSHNITALYSGDGVNAGGTSSALAQVVNKAGTSVTISAHTPNPSPGGAQVTVSIGVAAVAPGAGTPAGTVTVTDGTVSCPITLPATSCNLTFNGDGPRALAATYPGNATFAAGASPLVGHTVGLITTTLDIDASISGTKYDALTDGLLTLRYLFGLTGEPLISGAVGPTATRTTPSAILAYLDSARPSLDIDGNGSADALTDGLLLIRYLLGLRGDALISGAIGVGATRTTAPEIEAYMQLLLP